VYQNERKIDNTILRLAGEGYTVGDMVNSGYAKTLRIIAHRNNIINHCYNGNPVNNINIPMYPVSDFEGKSELDVLAHEQSEPNPQCPIHQLVRNRSGCVVSWRICRLTQSRHFHNLSYPRNRSIL
jgi:hypothetical protein